MHIPVVRKLLIPAKLNRILFCLDLLRWVKGQCLFEKYFKSIAHGVKAYEQVKKNTNTSHQSTTCIKPSLHGKLKSS